MTYFEAIEIKQDLLVNMQYAGAFHKTAPEALIEAADKYSIEQFQEAYKAICAKMKEEKEDLKELFTLAVKSKAMKRSDQ
jgi:hypothetical protein